MLSMHETSAIQEGKKNVYMSKKCLCDKMCQKKKKAFVFFFW